MKLNLSESTEYREYYVSHALPVYKIFLVVAFTLNILLAILQPLEIPIDYSKISFVRLVILATLFIAAFILISIPRIKNYSPVVITISSLVTALFLGYFSGSSNYLENEFYVYFVILVITIMSTTLVLGIPFIMSVVYNISILGSYIAVVVDQPTCTDQFCTEHRLTSLLLLCLAQAFSVSGSYISERRSMRLFKLQLEIKHDKESFRQQNNLVIEQQNQVINALQNVEESKKRLNAVFNNVLIGILILDTNLKVKYGNPAIKEMFGLSDIDIIQIEIRDFIQAKSRDWILDDIQKLINHSQHEFYAETILVKRTNQSFWAQLKISKLLDEAGKIESLVVVISNIDKLKKSEIEIKNAHEQLTESLRYSARIQSAILPNTEIMNSIFHDYFILYRPKNIISGDFYWAKRHDEYSLVVVADCTGHGVPGALMSILGVTLLNEIVNEIQNKHISTKSEYENIFKPSDMLNRLREMVQIAMQQTGKEGEAKDGMDISLCVVNWKMRSLEYAGAYNPVYIVRDSEIVELEADRMPIGIYSNQQSDFQNIEFELMPNDAVYMTTDGYADQFGGIKERKFMSKNLKKLILSVSKENMNIQMRILNETLDEWKGDLEQADDILILGFKVP